MDVVDSFTEAWERISGLTFEPWADIFEIVGMCDWLPTQPLAMQSAVDELLARSVSELG